MNIADIEAKSAARKKEAFANFMNDPQTRYMLSLLPQGESREALSVVLEACFSSGFAAGTGNMAISFLDQILHNKKGQS